MTYKNIIVGLDIGTSKVCAVVGELRDINLSIIGVGTAQTKGIKKGVVVDIDSTVKSVREAVNKAGQMANISIDGVYINYSGGQVSLKENRGVVAVSGENKEITPEDVERVIQASRVIAIPSGQEIIDIIPKEFIVDGFDGIKDPVGMVGIRLEVIAHIVTGSSTSVQNLVRSVERSNLDVYGIVLNSLANAQVLLTEDEKELGVAILDIGGGTTEISVFESGNLIYSSLIPIGGQHITNDIAVGLRIPFEQAEKIKREFGCASLSMAQDMKIQIVPIGSNTPKKITQKDLTEIIEPRVSEIFDLVAERLNKLGNAILLPAGVVLTGGGVSMLKGAKEIASSVLNIPVRTGFPDYIGVNEPIYTAAVGLVEYVVANKAYTNYENRNKTQRIQSFLHRVKKWLKEYF